MKLFKKFKNKKSAAYPKTHTMTEATSNLPNQTKLETSARNLASPDTATLESQPVSDTSPINDVKTFLPEHTTQPVDNAENADNKDNAMVTPPPTTVNIPAKIKLTGRMLNFTRLHITGNDFGQIKTQLHQKFGNQLNSKMLIVLSCEEKLDLAELLSHLWGLGLQPIGIVTGQMDEQATEQNLAIFPADGKRIDVLTDDKKANKPTPAITPAVAEPNNTGDVDKTKEQISPTTDTVPSQTRNFDKSSPETADSYISSLPQTSQLEGDLIYTTMLRSGQSINHVGGDLILTQGINAGAEAITDYSLHVYGKAEGRLVAGATGDENARVFCLRFNPSLVSVAGTFCLRENIPSEYLDKAVQVRFERDKGLIFTLMNG